MREGATLEQALEGCLDDLDGFYTFAVGTADGFAVLRDPIACKPAVMAETDEWVAMASEYRAIAVLPGRRGRGRAGSPSPGASTAGARRWWRDGDTRGHAGDGADVRPARRHACASSTAACTARRGRGPRSGCVNPGGRHAIAVGLDADCEVEIEGHVGYYCAGMNKHATVRVRGNCGVGVAENMMSGHGGRRRHRPASRRARRRAAACSSSTATRRRGAASR